MQKGVPEVMRGFNLWAHCQAQDVIDAVASGATLFRYQILPEMQIAQQIPLIGWDKWIETYINHIETRVLPFLGSARVILDMHSAPGGLSRSRHVCIRNRAAKERFLENWQTLARRFAGDARIIGYGVLNEPLGRHEEIAGLMVDAWNVIQREDDTKIVAVTSKQSTPRYLHHCVTLPGIWCECHMYQPMEFTHQGLPGRRTGHRYPHGKFNKQWLYKALRRPIELTAQGRQVFIGEFSATTWTDQASREAYLSDCISIFKEMGWPWCFHAWREAPCWNPEISNVVMMELGAGLIK